MRHPGNQRIRHHHRTEGNAPSFSPLSAAERSSSPHGSPLLRSPRLAAPTLASGLNDVDSAFFSCRGRCRCCCFPWPSSSSSSSSPHARRVDEEWWHGVGEGGGAGMAAVVAARGGRADEGAGVVGAGDRPAVEDLHQRFRGGSPRHHGAYSNSSSGTDIPSSTWPSSCPASSCSAPTMTAQ
jgi:hypothetical protein